MLTAPEIFRELYCIPLLMSASSPTITGTISVFTLRTFVISISRSLYFEIFSVTFVELFWSDGMPWSLITTYIRHVRWQLSIRIYLCVPKDCNLFNFGDSLRLVLIAPLRYFDFVNADTPFNGYMDICSCLINFVPLKKFSFGSSGHPVYDLPFLLACYEQFSVRIKQSGKWKIWPPPPPSNFACN